METKLNCLERLVTLSIMPKEGNFVTLRMMRDIVSRVGFSAQEITEFGIEELADGRVRWTQDITTEKAFTFVEAEVDLIKRQLKKMDDDGKLNTDTLSLYEKFCV
jgi:hypothetical protein